MVTTYENGLRERAADWEGPTDAPRIGSVQPSTASIAGHPLHPAVVPIPIGLLTAAAASDLAHALRPKVKRYVESIQEYIDAGYESVYIHQVGPDQEGFFTFWRDELRPALEKATPREPIAVG